LYQDIRNNKPFSVDNQQIIEQLKLLIWYKKTVIINCKLLNINYICTHIWLTSGENRECCSSFKP
jgi:hypothetical protein